MIDKKFTINHQPSTTPKQIFLEGRTKKILQGEEQEKLKKFTLRGGSAGCVTPYGEFIGRHPLETLARFMGYQVGIGQETRNIFDAGLSNEVIWDDILDQTDWAIKQEENYPLVVKDLFKYPLTGRPDAVVGQSLQGEFIPIYGIEHKAIASPSSAKILETYEPKTDNLIQAGVYSLFFQLPWYLVYSSNANFFKLKANKIEFPVYWQEGVLWFIQPNSNRVQTDITVQGILDFYEAIVEAYESKDHRFFKRGHMDYKGDYVQNWDEYSSFLLMVDKDLPWDEWVDQCRIASESDKVIKFAKVNKQPKYYFENIWTGEQSKQYSSLTAIRKDLYNG